MPSTGWAWALDVKLGSYLTLNNITSLQMHTSQHYRVDISVLPDASHSGANVTDNVEYAEKYNPSSIPDEVLQEQAERYHEIFELFLKYKSNIERVTLGHFRFSILEEQLLDEGRTDYSL